MSTAKPLLALLGAMLLASGNQPALAGPFDLRIGGFDGVWCGYRANFSIETKVKGRWLFHGRVMFPRYSQYADVADAFDIEQYDDDSIVMVRHLSGSQRGSYQRVWANPPRDGIHFEGYKAEGPDCVGKKTQFALR